MRTWSVNGACRLPGPHPDTPHDQPADLDLSTIEPLIAALRLPFVTVDLAQRADGYGESSNSATGRSATGQPPSDPKSSSAHSPTTTPDQRRAGLALGWRGHGRRASIGPVSEDRDWPARFDATFRNMPDNAQRRVWRAVYGDDYPEGVDPYSFISRSELDLLAHELRVGRGDLLADFGCGRGGPGLWLAGKTGANLVGVDVSSVALDAAAARARGLGLGGRVDYRLASMAETALPGGGVDAIVSIDALIFVPDKRAAIVEFARVLRPGGRLAVTTWDYHRQPAGRPPQVDDHRPLLEAAGFTLLTYAETVEWRQRLTAIYEGLTRAAEEIAEETGEPASRVREGIAEAGRTIDAMSRRVLIVAQRRESGLGSLRPGDGYRARSILPTT